MQPFESARRALLQQRRTLAHLLAPKSPAFRAYERRYEESLQGPLVGMTKKAWLAMLARDVVWVGDYHTHAASQQGFVWMVKEACRANKRPLTLALECVESRYQNLVDKFMKHTKQGARKYEAEFLRRIGYPYSATSQVWPNFRVIFDTARENDLKVVAIDSRPRGPNSLEKRDVVAARLVAQEVARGRQVYALFGQFHVAPAHAPQALKERAPLVSQVSVFQNPEAVFLRCLKNKSPISEFGMQPDGGLVLFNSTPIEAQQSFVDYVLSEAS